MTVTKPPTKPSVAEEPARRSWPLIASVEGPRRLQRMGAVTVGVSLPRQWVGERGLSAGSPIHLRTLPDGSLLLRDRLTNTPHGRAVITVGEHSSPEHLFRELVGAYLGGAVEFVLFQPDGIDQNTRNIAKLFTRRTIQPEIVSDEETTLLLKDVSLGTGLPIPQLLHRMFQVVLDLHRDAGRSWESSNPHPGESLAMRDDEVDRHAWLVERILTLRIASEVGTTGRGPVSDDPLQTLLLARALERIGDHAVSLAEYGTRFAESSPPRKAASTLTGYHQQVLELLRSAFAVAEHPDVELANEIIDTGEALHATHRALSDSFLVRGASTQLPPVAVASLGLILQSIDRTVAYAQDIAQVGLDRAAWGRIGRVATIDPLLPTSRSSLEPSRGGR